MKVQSFLFILLALSISSANIGGWVDHNGKPHPNTDSRKSIKDFSAMLIVTPETNWRVKWDTSPEITPNFKEAGDVKYKEKLSILLFFTNPLTNKDGEIKLDCEVKVIRPDKTLSIDQKVECGNGKLQGPPTNMRVPISLEFIGEPQDPPGKWLVQVTISDKIRNVSIPLKTSFVLKK